MSRAVTDVELRTTPQAGTTLYAAQAAAGTGPYVFAWTTAGAPAPEAVVMTNGPAGTSSLTLLGPQDTHGRVEVTATDSTGAAGRMSVVHVPSAPAPASPWSAAHTRWTAGFSAAVAAVLIIVVLRIAQDADGNAAEAARAVAVQLVVLAVGAAAAGAWLLAVEARTRAHVAGELRALRESARSGSNAYDKAAPDILLAMTRTRAPALLALAAAALLGAVVLAHDSTAPTRSAPIPTQAPNPSPTA